MRQQLELNSYSVVFPGLKTSNGCIRNTTAECGNITTGLLLRPRWPVQFFGAVSEHLMLYIPQLYYFTKVFSSRSRMSSWGGVPTYVGTFWQKRM